MGAVWWLRVRDKAGEKAAPGLRRYLSVIFISSLSLYLAPVVTRPSCLVTLPLSAVYFSPLGLPPAHL